MIWMERQNKGSPDGAAGTGDYYLDAETAWRTTIMTIAVDAMQANIIRLLSSYVCYDIDVCHDIYDKMDICCAHRTDRDLLPV